MIKRENAFVEAMKFISERNKSLAEKDQAKIQKRISSHAEFLNEYHKIIQNREQDRVRRNAIIEGCRNDNLATAIKAIYITALEAETLTDNGLILAEDLVDKYIATEGGASKIMRECKNKTYLLNRICDIVEEAAREDMRIIFEEDEEDDDDITKTDDEDDEEVDFDFEEEDKEESKDDNKSDEDEEVDFDFEEEEKSDDSESEEDTEDEEGDSEGEDDEDKEDESSEESEESEPDDDGDDDEDIEYDDVGDVKDDADQLDDEDTEPEVEDEVEKQMDEELPVDDTSNDIKADEEDEDFDNDGEEDIEPEPEDYDNKVLEDLDKEEDVQKAVALIRQRVADAEETFIKNNAKDKEQINALLGKISDNIKTVEDMADEDVEKGKDAVAQENVRMSRRAIDDITNSRPLTIMEMFARSLNKDIVKDEVLRENYIEEDGSLDMVTIVESAKVLYAFLETLNTIQLKTIDAKYIESIFS